MPPWRPTVHRRAQSRRAPPLGSFTLWPVGPFDSPARLAPRSATRAATRAPSRRGVAASRLASAAESCWRGRHARAVGWTGGRCEVGAVGSSRQAAYLASGPPGNALPSGWSLRAVLPVWCLLLRNSERRRVAHQQCRHPRRAKVERQAIPRRERRERRDRVQCRRAVAERTQPQTGDGMPRCSGSLRRPRHVERLSARRHGESREGSGPPYVQRAARGSRPSGHPSRATRAPSPSRRSPATTCSPGSPCGSRRASARPGRGSRAGRGRT